MNDLSKWGTDPNRSWAKFNLYLADVSMFNPLKMFSGRTKMKTVKNG